MCMQIIYYWGTVFQTRGVGGRWWGHGIPEELKKEHVARNWAKERAWACSQESFKKKVELQVSKVSK